MTFRKDAEACATQWKQSTPSLPDAAREPGTVNGRGTHSYCLPVEYAGENLLPEARHALDWFADAQIPWHMGIGSGPTNHLLSSQVQCVNALAPMSDDPDAIRYFFGGALDITEVLPSRVPEAPDALVGFEWIGDDNPLGEWRDDSGTRGSMNTSSDAVIRYRTSTGSEEIALIEWKYVETYVSAGYDDKHLQYRLNRYIPLLDEPDCPIRSDITPADLICEPIYQLMRLQLLAWQTERANDSISAARVVICAPRDNLGYHHALPSRLRSSAPSPSAEATDLQEMWSGLLVDSDCFKVIDTGRLVDPVAPTSVDFKCRYAHLAREP